MLINKPGAEFLYNGITYRIGDVIIGSDQSEYAGLIGSIFEIRDGSDKETENDTPDIYCSFDPPVLPTDIAKVEAVFSDLYGTQKILDDICFDMVIMAPEMITVPGQSKKSIKLYILSEDWAANGGTGHSSSIYSDPLEARARLNEALGNEIDSGCLSDWINTPEYRTETSENSYEGWLDGFYCESHYAISLEERNVVLTPSVIGDVGRDYLDASRYEDFACQVEQWEEISELSEEDYQRYLGSATGKPFQKLRTHCCVSIWIEIRIPTQNQEKDKEAISCIVIVNQLGRLRALFPIRIAATAVTTDTAETALQS